MNEKPGCKVRLDAKLMVKDLFDDKEFLDEMGLAIRDESLNMIAKGISPVEGEGRFEGYKAQRGGAKSKGKSKFGVENKGYPLSVQKKYPGKNVRPVNLFLSGDMLKFLRHAIIKSGIRFGIIGAPSEVETRARVHNTGERSDIPQRKFIPWEPGDDFAPSIQRRIRQEMRKHVERIIAKFK